MKKQVLFIIDSLTCGGAEKSLVSLLPLLNQEKYKLYLWMRSPGGAFASLVPKHVHIANQPEYTIFEHLKFKLGGILYSIMFRWNKFIGKNEHASETLWKCQGWALKIPAGKWDTVVAYQQGIPTFLAANKFTDCKKIAWINADIFKAGYNTKFNSKFYQKFDYICPVSDVLHKMMNMRMPEFSEKYITVWDIINPDLTRKLAKESCANLRKDNGEYIFVTTGRLVPPKGYDIAIEAAKILKENGVKFKWYFIGDGPERQKIEHGIKTNELLNHIVLLGLQTNPYKYMEQADVYVQTSKFEGFGMTIAEAKILGKPIVSTNFDVVYNQITHEKNGLIAEMNGKSIADSIYRMITDNELRNSIIEEVNREVNTTHLTEAKKVEALIDK